MFPPMSREIAAKRRELTPETQAAFDAFGKAVFADGALPARVKQIIAVAAAHARNVLTASKATPRRRYGPARPPRNSWSDLCRGRDASGGAYAHSALTLATIEEEQNRQA